MSVVWERQYAQKLTTAREAVSGIQNNDTVVYCPLYLQTPDLDAALADRVNELQDVRIDYSSLTFLPEPLKRDPKGEHFIHCDLYYTAMTRKLVREGYVIYGVPWTYHELGEWCYRGICNYDYMFVAATPMDENGYFNLSCSNSAQQDYIRSKGGYKRNIKVIVEVNPHLPYVHGDNFIHISQVDHVVESTNPQPLPPLPVVSGDEVDMEIAKLIVQEIPNGACVQLGIGGLPNKIGKMIADSDLKNLGCHTEMFVDAYMDIFNAGKLTNTEKVTEKGYSVFTFAMGSRELYHFMDHNPGLLCMPAYYTNRPEVIAQNPNFISINSCLNVDIHGSVSSESVGWKQISSTGGQLDFHLASLKSDGGKGFLCLHSTKRDKNGNLVSNIVPSFEPGTQVTVPPSITNSIVTEYGIASIKGLCQWQRAESLINIAHPVFRDELIQSAEKAGIWRKSNKR